MTSTKFYRIAGKKHDVGDTMMGRGTAPLQDRFPMVEEILERRRPADCPPRADCIYMRDARDFRTVGVTYKEGYVHEVEPVGKVDQRDIAWIGSLQWRYFPTEKMRKDEHPPLSDDELADRYWGGVASEKPTWEWVSKEGTVKAVDDVVSPVSPPRLVF